MNVPVVHIIKLVSFRHCAGFYSPLCFFEKSCQLFFGRPLRLPRPPKLENEVSTFGGRRKSLEILGETAGDH
jgi:hypothetical protein